MNSNNSEKDEKSKNTIEITISPNGVVSGGKSDSSSENNGMCDMKDDDNEVTSKEGQMSNQSTSSDSSNEGNSKKHQSSNQSDISNSSEDSDSKKGKMSNESDSNNFSNDAASKKEQIIINITHQ